MQKLDQGIDRGPADLPESSGGVPPHLLIGGLQDADEGLDRGLTVIRNVEPRLVGNEVAYCTGVVRGFPPELPENGGRRPSDAPLRRIDGLDEEGDCFVTDLPERVAGAELHLAVAVGKRCDERRHSGAPDAHERGSRPDLRRDVPERSNQCRDRFLADQGKGFGEAPSLPVARKSKRPDQGLHGIGPTLCDGTGGTSANPGIVAPEVIDERLYRAFIVSPRSLRNGRGGGDHGRQIFF